MILPKFYIEIPTYENGVWTETIFDDLQKFRDFVLSCFKEPGKYELDETTFLFNEQARLFHRQGKVYCMAPYRSKDFMKYWEFEKKKNRNGAIFKHNGKTWYLPRDYYMWVNFLPIYDKMEKKFDFLKVWDVQIHLALYECLAELYYKHAAVVKKRQIASSYFHCAKLINRIWFDEGVILKMGASLKDYINLSGSWKFLDEYKSFLNSNTAWYRPMNPGKVLEWQQQIEVRQNGRKKNVGLKGMLQGMSFEQSATKGVGGPCHKLGTLILMADGHYKAVEDIQVGEYILGIDNLPKRVLRCYRGVDELYRVSPSRGISYYTTGDHILYLETRDPRVKGDKKRLTKVRDWSNLTNYQKRVYVGKRNDKPLLFPNKASVTLDPYFLGLWLGDGYREKAGVIVNKTRDPEILDFLETLSDTLNIPLNVRRKEEARYNDEMYSCFFGISENRVDNSVTKNFIKYNLFYNKHIPDDYLYGTPEVRLQVLAGYLDTDGHYEVAKSKYHFSCKNDTLFNQIVFLARSLGAVVHCRRTSSNEHVTQDQTICYSETNVGTISFKNSSIVPTRVKRKQPVSYNKQKSIHSSCIKEIKSVGVGEYAGIEVEDNLYYLEDLTITHNCTIFYYEEGGIAPTADITYEFIRPALKMGEITTGLFVIAGSVGELTHCDPLKEMITNPTENDIYGVETDLFDETGVPRQAGLFIPEQWGMPPYIDEFGNSMVKEALEALDTQFEKWKKDLSPSAYQYRVSQHPRTIKECFASRDVSLFPTDLIEYQDRCINNHDYPYELLDLDEDMDGNIIVKKATQPPISQWPIKKDLPNKEGCLVVWERPGRDIPWGEYLASVDPVAEGKAESVDNLIYTPSGKRRIGDIKKGDYVFRRDGNAVKVLNVFPQGLKDLYRVKFNDGSSLLVCKEHLWSVSASDNDKQEYHVLSLEQMLDNTTLVESTGVGRNKNKIYTTQTYYKKTNNGNRWKIPICEPLIFKTNTIPLDPYFLGLLLGDAGLSTRGIRFSTNDEELVNEIKKMLPTDVTIKKLGKCDYRISTSGHRNSITKILRDLGLMGKKSNTKFIPEIYLYSSVANRLSLVQGLMDTDGYCGNHGAEYYSISKALAEGMVELVRSLGGIARIRCKKTSGKMKGCGYVYVVRVSLPATMNPFKLKRKAALYKPNNKFSRYISDITFEKTGEAICIQIDDKSGLYVTENAIVTHNIITSDSLCSIYIYRRATHVKRYTENGVENFIEGDKIVAAWCGRFDDINNTHKRLRLMLEWYNAWAIVENNVSLFIQYMIKERKQRFLVPKNQILFLKEVQANKTVYQDYGWRNTGTLFKTHLLSYLIEFLKEVVEEETDDFGNITRKYYGIRRIPDPMVLKEMLGYGQINVDRLVSLAALIAFIKIQQSNMERPVRVENDIEENLENSQKMLKLNKSMFRNVGNPAHGSSSKKVRSPFKRLH